MNYKIELSTIFSRQFKKLSKKHPSLRQELITLRSALSQNPKYGIPIGKDCYKIRIAIKSKGKGKSGGGRVITHLHVQGSKIFLLTIFDKSEKENITEEELEMLVDSLDL